MSPRRRAARRPRAGGRIRRADGFTTIEIMVACVVALIVVYGISMLPGSVLRHFGDGTERLRLQQNTHRVAQRIAIQVRKASSYRIYDPANPATTLAAGPAVELSDSSGVCGGFRASDDGGTLLDGGGNSLDDMTLTDLWFEEGADGELVLSLAFRDRRWNETSLVTRINPRNPEP